MRRNAVGAAVLTLVVLAGCATRGVSEAEAKRDVAWLVDQGSPEAVAALGRLADTDAAALKALEARATTANDVHVYIAAWMAVTRNAPWGAAVLRAGLADPSRAETTATALPRRDPHLVPFTGDLESAVVRLAAVRRSGVIAGVLASIGPPAHAAVEKRLLDAKTRGAMCDGISVPEASGDARSLVLAVPPEARDHPSCIALVLEMAKNEDPVLGWLAATAEPGLLTAAAKGTLPCARLASVWEQGLTTRGSQIQGALVVPLQLSIGRCTSALDPVLGRLLTKAPRARACIMNAIDPFGAELAQMKETCEALRAGATKNESPRIRERSRDALSQGCRLAR